MSSECESRGTRHCEMRSPIYRTGSAQPGNAWPGKNNFCCCGRCITGPRVEHGGWAMFWAPTIVVGVPLLAVGGWRCIVSPSVLNPLAVIIPAMFYSMTLTCQCLTSCTDPGSEFFIIDKLALIHAGETETRLTVSHPLHPFL